MPVNLASLTIELTRRCNMACKHCMRGDPEPLVFGSELSAKLCSQLNHVGQLTLTGGEPSLAANEINNLLYYLKNCHVTIECFFVATNAFEYSPVFLDALDELYHYCQEPSSCKLSISTDQFHAPASQEAVKQYRSKPYYNPSKEKGEIRPYEILNEGRAAETGLGRFDIPLHRFIYNYDFKGLHCSVSDGIYVNARGDVLLNGDLSYAHQTEYALGNILDKELDEILMHALYSYDRFENGYSYTLHVKSDSGLIPPKFHHVPANDIKLAVSRYMNLTSNLIYFKGEYASRKLPDDLVIEVRDLKKWSPDFLMGEKLIYTSASEGMIGTVEMMLTRTKLVDGDDDDAGS